jgi:hypothetical protein
MSVSADAVIRRLSQATRKRVEDRAAEIIAGEASLRELQNNRKVTKARAADDAPRRPGKRVRFIGKEPADHQAS